MSTLRQSVFLFLLSTVFIFSSCEDPSNLGLGIVDSDGAGAHRINVSADTTFSFSEQDQNGSHPLLNLSGLVWAGQTNDPYWNVIKSTSYLDFNNTTPGKVEYQNSDSLLSIRLKYTKAQVYGNTTEEETLTLSLFQITEELDLSDSLSSNSPLNYDSTAPILTNIVFEGDSIQINLPAEYLENQDNRDLWSADDSTFKADFHGFALAPNGPDPASGNGIIFGIWGQQSKIRLITAADTANFEPVIMYSNFTRSETPSIADQFLPLIDESNQLVALKFNLEADTLRDFVMIDALLRVYADTVDTALPANYTIETPLYLELKGITPLGAPTNTANGAWNHKTQAFEFRLTNLIKRLIDDELAYEISHFSIQMPTVLPSPNGLLIYKAGSQKPPELVLTVVD